MSGPFTAGEQCLLIDTKGRHYLVLLAAGKTFQFHGGTLAHDAIIGSADGSRFDASTGRNLLALRPRLADYILAMPRGAQVVYPKDIGPLLVWGDIGPGMTVLEAGTGSGALAMALLRAVGPRGRLVSVERREDHAAHARRSIEKFFGEIPPNLDLRAGDVADHMADVAPDRLVLDVPEPWEVVDGAAAHLADGGVLSAYLPTVPQVQELRAALRRVGFAERETIEVLHREWAAEGRSVRPEHQMVGHTGFLTFARKAQPRAEPDT